MNFIPSAASFIGRLVRAPLKLVPALVPLRVLTGPLAGQRWLSTAGPHGCWLGIYERDLQALLVRTLRPGQVVWDIGANVGFFTLLSALRVGPHGQVVAVEPQPRNLELLRRHLALNAIANVTVIDSAVADAPGTASFDTAGSPSMGHLAAGGTTTVTVTTIDELVASGMPAPQVIKMDIEGAESRALIGAARTLAQHRPLLLLSTHGYAQHEACLQALEAAGYRVTLRRDGSADGQYEVVATPLQPAASDSSARTDAISMRP
jgi:FkbM family methyltransferase